MRAVRLDKVQRLQLLKITLIPRTWVIPVHIVIHGHAQELEESSGIYQNVTFIWH